MDTPEYDYNLDPLGILDYDNFLLLEGITTIDTYLFDIQLGWYDDDGDYHSWRD